MLLDKSLQLAGIKSRTSGRLGSRGKKKIKKKNMENSAAKCAMVAQGLYFEFLIVARLSMQ